jgi:hypothetical protein
MSPHMRNWQTCRKHVTWQPPTVDVWHHWSYANCQTPGKHGLLYCCGHVLCLWTCCLGTRWSNMLQYLHCMVSSLTHLHHEVQICSQVFFFPYTCSRIRIRYFISQPSCKTTHEVVHSLTHRAEPFSRSRWLCSYSGTSQHFMEPKGSLPWSQEPSTGPYPNPDQSNPRHLIPSLPS